MKKKYVLSENNHIDSSIANMLCAIANELDRMNNLFEKVNEDDSPELPKLTKDEFKLLEEVAFGKGGSARDWMLKSMRQNGANFGSDNPEDYIVKKKVKK